MEDSNTSCAIINSQSAIIGPSDSVVRMMSAAMLSVAEDQ